MLEQQRTRRAVVELGRGLLEEAGVEVDAVLPGRARLVLERAAGREEERELAAGGDGAGSAVDRDLPLEEPGDHVLRELAALGPLRSGDARGAEGDALAAEDRVAVGEGLRAAVGGEADPLEDRPEARGGLVDVGAGHDGAEERLGRRGGGSGGGGGVGGRCDGGRRGGLGGRRDGCGG
ncbi:hypothetical protein [Clavibacter sp. VKM Ac-2872]|uniref:hypothetical protein n=1 Tax=Clavibacter sp. VKM Ac-2872 TaxID=2783812 RepID=UPI001E4C5DD4|nr:hypothetical protein [Clavibacter sp. VKM Ac-2872]